MTRIATDLSATVIVDRFTNSTSLPEYSQFRHQIDGSQPYVRSFKIEIPAAPADILPEGAVIERCVTTDSSVVVLATVPNASILVAALQRSVSVQVAATEHDIAEVIGSDIRSRIPEPSAETVPVRVWSHRCDGNVTSADRHIEAPRWSAIAQNYAASTRHALSGLLPMVRPEGAGKLVLWHGPPGTGKTTAVRALAREWAPWCQMQYIADPERFFGEPAYIAEVLATAPTAKVSPTFRSAGRPDAIWRLVIAEDTDEYLRSTARRDSGAALGRLLNLTDGILGQGMNTIILLTTNEELSRLHPAIIRPGRCMASVEFPAFTAGEASEWLGSTVAKPHTLAELLERTGTLATVGGEPSQPLRVGGQYL